MTIPLLSGYKTYIVAAIAILAVIAESFLGWDVPGVDVEADGVQIILNALGLGTLRHGLTSTVAKAVLGKLLR